VLIAHYGFYLQTDIAYMFVNPIRFQINLDICHVNMSSIFHCSSDSFVPAVSMI
jgi:hypothetical protein